MNPARRLSEEGSTAVRLHQTPERVVKSTARDTPEEIPLPSGTHGQQQPGPRVFSGGKCPRPLVTARQAQPPPKFRGLLNTPLFMPILMEKFFQRRTYFSEIMAKGHPDGDGITPHGVHDAHGMRQYAAFLYGEWASRYGGSALDFLKPDTQTGSFIQYLKKTSRA